MPPTAGRAGRYCGATECDQFGYGAQGQFGRTSSNRRTIQTRRTVSTTVLTVGGCSQQPTMRFLDPWAVLPRVVRFPLIWIASGCHQPPGADTLVNAGRPERIYPAEHCVRDSWLVTGRKGCYHRHCTMPPRETTSRTPARPSITSVPRLSPPGLRKPNQERRRASVPESPVEPKE